MKKLRRIEITAFRRRTTIVLRDRSEVCPAERPPCDGESPLIPTDQSPATESGLDQTQITNPDAAGQSGLHQGREAKEWKLT